MIGAAVALAFVVPVTVLLVAALGAHVGHQAALGVPAGHSHDGAPLRLAGVRQVAIAPGLAPAGAPAASLTLTSSAAAGALALRQGCAWGEPGRDPYRGSTEQALFAAGLPAEVVLSIAAQRAAGRSAARLRITREGIRSVAGAQFFDPRRIDLSFGMTMCRGSRVNFVPGHVEMADLYEATDARGRRHAVMVPDVCGNVSVLQAAGDQGVVASVSASLEDRAMALSSLAEELIEPETEELGGAEPGRPSLRGGGSSLPGSGGALVTGRSPHGVPGWPTLLTAGYLSTVSKTLTGGSTVLRTLTGTTKVPPEGGGGSDAPPPPVVPPASGPQPPASGPQPPPPVPQPPASQPNAPEPPASGPPPPPPPPPPSPPPVPQPPASQPPVPQPPASQPPLPQPPASQPLPPVPPRVPRPSIVQPPPSQVPEPGSLAMALLALGLAGLVTRWRRRQAAR